MLENEKVKGSEGEGCVALGGDHSLGEGSSAWRCQVNAVFFFLVSRGRSTRRERYVENACGTKETNLASDGPFSFFFFDLFLGWQRRPVSMFGIYEGTISSLCQDTSIKIPVISNCAAEI